MSDDLPVYPKTQLIVVFVVSHAIALAAIVRGWDELVVGEMVAILLVATTFSLIAFGFTYWLRKKSLRIREQRRD